MEVLRKMATAPKEIASRPIDATYCGAPINNMVKGLPRMTISLCPECGNQIEARLFEESGKVYMDKTCPEHGYIRDLYWSDVELYLKSGKMGVRRWARIIESEHPPHRMPGQLRPLREPHQPHGAG